MSSWRPTPGRRMTAIARQTMFAELDASRANRLRKLEVALNASVKRIEAARLDLIYEADDTNRYGLERYPLLSTQPLGDMF